MLSHCVTVGLYKVLFLGLLVVTAQLPVVAESSPTADPGASRESPPGKLYAYKRVDGEELALEVYLPQNHEVKTARAPALLLFHGGGWSRGSRTQFRAVCAYFASRGMVAATADYRMIPKADIPNLPAGESYKRICVTDAKSAIRWLKQHAIEFGLDTDRLITGGGSAGAHIAVLASANSEGLNDPDDPSGFDTRVMAHLLFNPAFAPKDTDAEINVLAHLRTDFPPAVVFFGSADRWKPAWDDTQRKLNALGSGTVVQWVAAGGGHGFYLKQPWKNLTLAAADRFFVSLGCLQGQPTIPTTKTDRKVLQLDTADLGGAITSTTPFNHKKSK